MHDDYPDNVRSFSEGLTLFSLDRFVDNFNALVQKSVMDKHGNFHNAEAEEMYAHFAKAFVETCKQVEEGSFTDDYISVRTADSAIALKRKLEEAAFEAENKAVDDLIDDEQEIVEKNIGQQFYGLSINPNLIDEIYGRLELVEAMLMVIHQQMMDKNSSDDTKRDNKTD